MAPSPLLGCWQAHARGRRAQIWHRWSSRDSGLGRTKAGRLRRIVCLPTLMRNPEAASAALTSNLLNSMNRRAPQVVLRTIWRPIAGEPDPSLSFVNGRQQKARAYLKRQVLQAEAFVCLWCDGHDQGAPRRERNEVDLDPAGTQPFSIQLDADNLPRAVAISFGLPKKRMPQKGARWPRSNRFSLRL